MLKQAHVCQPVILYQHLPIVEKKLDILINGVNINNDEFISTNVSLTIAVQNFILQTKRFSENSV